MKCVAIEIIPRGENVETGRAWLVACICRNWQGKMAWAFSNGSLMSQSPAKIFISYRRTDTGQTVRDLATVLKQAFGSAAVFVDVTEIRIGSEWPEEIDRALKKADILLVALGPDWLSVGGEQRRLDQEKDWVRNEIAKSIKRKIPVIPLLIGGAALPNPDALPACLAKLSTFQKFDLTSEHWERDVSYLIDELVKIGCRHLRTPKIVLMDSPAKVYKPNPVAGEMNSHVIRRLLQSLLPREVIDIEPVHRDWDGSDVISRKRPDLIVIHYSCLDDGKGLPRHLMQFLEKMLLTSENTNIIVYSRTTASPGKKVALAFERRIRNLAPGRGDRVYGLPVYRRKMQPQTFRDPDTASALRTLVREVLTKEGGLNLEFA